jgi:hypothetical protein
MHTKHLRLLIAVGLITLLGLGQTQARQTTPVPAEADTEAFLNTNFLLQEAYSRVLCVAQDGSCPGEVTATVPCLTLACAHQPSNYAVAETFDTIQGAADSAQPGDLIIIMPGRYSGIAMEQTGGNDGAYIHFLGWGEPGSVVVDAPADPNADYLRHHFYFIAAHHYILQNLAFENAANGAGIFFSGFFSGTGQFSNHIIVMDVYSHDNGVWGLHTTATSYMVIQDSIFTTSGEEHGVYISGSGDNMLIRRNVFQDNVSSGLQINADPQTATSELFYWIAESTGDTCGWSEADVEDGGTATWDDLKACYDSQGLPDLGEFIEDGISENMIIEQNVMTGNGIAGGAAINLASVRNSWVRNNLVYGNLAGGISCWDNEYSENKGLDVSPFGCQNVVIYNNSMVDESGGRGAVILARDARDMVVVNNIIVRDRFDAYEVIEGSSQGLYSDANYYFALNLENPEAVTQIDTGAGSTSITGFSIQEALGNFVAPGFAPWLLEVEGWPKPNPERPDYRLLATSPLVTAGDPTRSPAYDLLGTPRLGTEIGALSVSR